VRPSTGTRYRAATVRERLSNITRNNSVSPRLTASPPGNRKPPLIQVKIWFDKPTALLYNQSSEVPEGP
jgi:hypothetical protein